MFKKNIKRNDISKNLSLKTGFPVNITKKLVNDLINLLIVNIKKGSFSLKNVGSFKIINKKERVGRNPKTKEEYVISSRKSISFTVSKKLSENLKKLYE